MNSNIFSFHGTSGDPQQHDGLRVAIQPGMSCQGWPADVGSKALEHYVALEDATVIRLLKKAGARIVGTSFMSELGLGLTGETGALAVAENIADAALITDNMGEARAAAAREGLLGFKPSYGIISRLGLIGLIPSMECWGIAALDFHNIRSLLTAICVRDDQDFSMTCDDLPKFDDSLSSMEPSGVIGIAEGYEKKLTGAERSAWQAALAAIENAGFQIKTFDLASASLFSSVHHVVGSVEASSAAGKYDGVRYGHRASGTGNWNDMYLKSRGESFGPFIKAYLFQGAYFQFDQYAAFEKACRLRGCLMDETGEVFKQVDWTASLTIREKYDAGKVANIGDMYDAFSFTIPANVTGLPALQIPNVACYKTMDFGLQITGPYLSDPRLLALGKYLLENVGGLNR